MNDLDEDRSIHSICLHEFEQHFDRGIFGQRMRALREGEGAIMFPDVYVRVDQERLFLVMGEANDTASRPVRELTMDAARKYRRFIMIIRSSLSVRTIASWECILLDRTPPQTEATAYLDQMS
jgi:hypothetical protein